jgi:hypothetical protein
MINEDTAQAVDLVFSNLVRSMKLNGRKTLSSEDLGKLAILAQKDKSEMISNSDKKIVQFVLQALSDSMKEDDVNRITVHELEKLVEINKVMK